MQYLKGKESTSKNSSLQAINRTPLILIVDDESDMQELVRQRFRRKIRKEEIRFLFADNGAEALDILSITPDIDMVITDINMPVMDGLTLLSKIQDRFPDIKTIIVSAYSDMKNIRRAMNNGAFDFLTKPIDFKDFESTIDKTILHIRDLQMIQHEEARLLEITSAIASELHLDALLALIMDGVTELLGAERSSLFLYYPQDHTLRTCVAQGLNAQNISIPADSGIAGAVFTLGRIIKSSNAYEDPRFNQRIDKETGFITQNMINMPIETKDGRRIGVVQVLNKRNGDFSDFDENRLQALTAQAAIAIENARMFEDILNMRNYNEGILSSLSNGVISLDEKQTITKVNAAATRILGQTEEELVDQNAAAVFGKKNYWLVADINRASSDISCQTLDRELRLHDESEISVNATAVPLSNIANQNIGSLLVLEDISAEKRLRTSMSRYLSSAVVNRLLEEEGDTLGGTAQDVTILFSDIRKFTSISEEIGAKRTVALLNEYFGIMVDSIEKNNGILDKYIGDAIMAIFGAPFISSEDANNAVKTAYEMLSLLKALNKNRNQRGEAAISIGIGINSGEVILGNIGSQRRMDYTVIGDAVNLAARLESATKQYNTSLLISAFTYQALDPALQQQFREIDRIRVRGRSHGIEVYDAPSLHLHAQNPFFAECMKLEAKGMEAYRMQDWFRAEQFFKKSQRFEDYIGLAPIYLPRIEHYQRFPPESDWDGVWTLTKK
ncbi:MAG: adenylate/guanylate cyclase domain-containing protein [Myxococcota bacterium]|nr:adenylate/guanylate cyclase domain-containing protein [Myxococcota bacterium]